ncbi:hypothetical protein Tco_0968796 [Tanacetum coccineum]
MVASLEKLERNADFHEIVDFLTASSIHYALTVSPTIYASYIEQFWNTAHSQTVNDVKQIHATVDGKTVVISESSVRSDLHFNDEDGITCLTNDAIFENLALMGITLAEPFNDVYQTPTHTKKVFTNMKRKRKDFSGRVTPLFASMLAPPVVEGEGSDLQEDTQLPQTSVPIPNVADKAIFKEWDDRVVRATTTAASLDAAHASGNITKTQSNIFLRKLVQVIDLGGNTPGSDEEILEQDDLTDFVPPTSYDSPLSGGYIPGSDEDCIRFGDQKAEKMVRKLEKKLRARTLGMKLFKIGTFKRKSLDKEYVSKQGRKSDKTKPMFDDSDFAELDVDNAMENVEGDAETQGRNTAKQITTAGDIVNTASIDVSAVGPSNVSNTDPSTSTVGDIFEDEMMTIADTLVAIRSTRPRTTSVVIRDVEEELRRSTPVPTVQSQDKGKGKMFKREQRIAKERAAEQEAKDAALIIEFEDVQARMDADALLAARLQEKEREKFFIDEQARLLVETIAERKRFFAAQRAEQIRNTPPTKIQLRNKMITYLKNMGRITYNQLKNKSGKNTTSSKKRPRAEPDEESVKSQKIREALVEEVYVEVLHVKYPIIDWEVYFEDTRRYWRIIRVGNHTEAYQIFADMLKKFNRDDMVKPWDLKLQRYMHDPLVWRLYDTCGVHHVSLVRGHDIFMLVEKEYPLTKGTLRLMMVARLLVEVDSEMSRELLTKDLLSSKQTKAVRCLDTSS